MRVTCAPARYSGRPIAPRLEACRSDRPVISPAMRLSKISGRGLHARVRDEFVDGGDARLGVRLTDRRHEPRTGELVGAHWVSVGAKADRYRHRHGIDSERKLFVVAPHPSEHTGKE